MRAASLLLVVSSSLFLAPPSFATDDQGGCEKNFSVSGSFFSGKQFKTSSDLPGISTEIAFKKAYASVVKKGYQIMQSDKDVGMISAAQQVSFSQGGKTAPLNIIVEPNSGGGSKIAFSFSIAGGLMTSEDAVRDEFCKITNEILGQ